MPKLILQNNYLFKADNFMCPNRIRKVVNNNFKLIKRNGNAFIFTDGINTFTLWSNHRYCENWKCYITPEKNGNYRSTKYQLNSNSVYVWITIKQIPIEFEYLKSYNCIIILQKYLSLVKFYNKVHIKKHLKRTESVTRVFQNNSLVRHIGEFL